MPTLAGTPLRRSSRQRKTALKSLKGLQAHDDGEDYDPSKDDDEEDDDEDIEIGSIPKPVKKRKTMSVQSNTTTTNEIEDIKLADLPVKVELAKTGRSKCRKCLEQIGKGEIRVGMTAWIMGRQSITWQHPACFFANVSFTRETSGRSKCKLTNARFARGEARFTCRSHTAAINLKLAVLSICLQNIISVVGKAGKLVNDKRGIIGPTQWEGYDTLEESEKVQVSLQWKNATSSPIECKKKEKGENGDKQIKDDKCESEEESEGDQNYTLVDGEKKQPVRGQKVKAIGRVAWKWGNHVCFGSLLPVKEENEKCYARTHKGNIKSLKKGGSYWWIVSE
eukprot:CAMPEP_0114516930 /NCGR_PEP_ID=MMETSP0109-20121206/17610_1 /TAXON_ID=29199 /ORGANISM="Chlorarachnion reptans, Strain CCCM449" /LENGTH=336 /DNA_ID=CAMNT_0001697391 /DNA_START=128 /DNA_END=1138 /DNA_ORIENTATION=+